MIAKQQTFFRQTIDVRSLEMLVTHATERIVPLIICQDEQDIRSRRSAVGVLGLSENDLGQEDRKQQHYGK